MTIVAIIREFDFSRNKGKHAGCSCENAGMREERRNAGFPERLLEGCRLCHIIIIRGIQVLHNAVEVSQIRFPGWGKLYGVVGGWVSNF